MPAHSQRTTQSLRDAQEAKPTKQSDYNKNRNFYEIIPEEPRTPAPDGVTDQDQPLPRGHGRHGGRLRLRQREGRGGRDLAHAGPLMRTTHAQGQRADSNHPPAQTRTPAGLLMQMLITYAPEQRADSNHPPAQTSQLLAELEQPSCMLELHAFSINGYSKNRNFYEIIPEDPPTPAPDGVTDQPGGVRS